MDGAKSATTDEEMRNPRDAELRLHRAMWRAVWFGIGFLASTFIWYWLSLWIPLTLCVFLGAICLYAGWIWSWVRGEPSTGHDGQTPSPEAASTIALLRIIGTFVAVPSFVLGLVADAVFSLSFDLSSDRSEEYGSLEPLLTIIIPWAFVFFGLVAATITHAGIVTLRKK